MKVRQSFTFTFSILLKPDGYIVPLYIATIGTIGEDKNMQEYKTFGMSKVTFFLLLF